MGAAGSHLTKYIRRFNVIDRTERILDKEKPIPAPLHKVDAERLKDFKSNLCSSVITISILFKQYLLLNKKKNTTELYFYLKNNIFFNVASTLTYLSIV